MDKRNNRVVLSLGGNIGNVSGSFVSAIGFLKDKVGNVVVVSPIYRTEAWGVENQPDFLNQVLVIDSVLSPHDVLERCMAIELDLGRVREQKWYERTIDIDILFYNNEIIKSVNLVVPHLYVHKRNFVLFPLVDVMPNFKHPLLNKSMMELKKECKDKLHVVRC